MIYIVVMEVPTGDGKTEFRALPRVYMGDDEAAAEAGLDAQAIVNSLGGRAYALEFPDLPDAHTRVTKPKLMLIKP